MNQRERRMLLVVCTVGGFAVLFAGYLGVSTLIDRLDQKDNEILHLQSEVNTNKAKKAKLLKDQQRWDRWQAISFPPDVSTANNRYTGYLQDLSRKHKLEVRSVADGGGRGSTGRGATFTPLSYTLTVEGTLSQFISFMKEFYTINLPHQIKDITMAPTPRGNGTDTKIEATIKLEALTLSNIPNRDFLPAIPSEKALRWDIVAGLSQAPAGLAVGLWSLTPVGLFGGENKLAAGVKPSRDYSKLTTKNVFVGLSPASTMAAKKDAIADKDILKFVRLTDIHIEEKWREAGLYNQRVNKSIRLRCETGKDTFTVRDSGDQVILNGRVKQINRRDMIIVVDGKHFSMHVGESLQQAMQKELKPDQLKALAKLGE